MQFQQQQNFNREPLSPVQAAVLQTLDWYIHSYCTDATCGNSNLTDAVNLRLKYDRELFHASPHQVGHVLTSFGLTERKRTNAGWVLLLSRDTRAGIHTLLRRYAPEIDSSVNREGCTLCSDLKKTPSGSNESTAELQKTVAPGGPQSESVNMVNLVHLKRDRRRRELLATSYFHVVFTVLHEFNVLALDNARLFYDLLFSARAQSLLEIAADPKHLPVANADRINQA